MTHWGAWLAVGVLRLSNGQATAQPEPTPAPTPRPTPDAANPGGPGQGDGVVAALADIVLTPVEWTTDAIIGSFGTLFAAYPDVTQSGVLEVHATVFTVTVAVATAAVVWLGVLHLTDQVDGTRPIVAVLVAVGVGAVAPEVLAYPVHLSQLTTEALLPAAPTLQASGSFTLQMALVAVIDVFVLLGIVLVFLGRNMYLVLGTALAPLLALLAVTPGFRRYARSLVNVWVACLLIGPFNAVLLNLLLAMQEGNLGLAPWLWTLTGHVLLLGLPLTVLGAGVVVLGPGFSLARRTPGRLRHLTHRIRRWRTDTGGPRDGEPEFRAGRRPRRGGDRRNRFDWRDRR